MVNLYDFINNYLSECDCATPGNTLGMVNPMMPTAEEPGTDPLPIQSKRRKKKKDLKESLLDDIEDIESEQDLLLTHPFKYLFEQSEKCNGWNQIFDLLKSFKDVLELKGNSAKLTPRRPFEKTGIYSKYWLLGTHYKLNKTELICKFGHDFDWYYDNKQYLLSDDNIHDILALGFCKTCGIRFYIENNKLKWRVGGSPIIDQLNSKDALVYLINQKSPIYDDYKEQEAIYK